MTSACDGNYKSEGHDYCQGKDWRCPSQNETDFWGDCGWVYTADDGTHAWVGCDQDDGHTLCHDIW